jgi:hypothetical protein
MTAVLPPFSFSTIGDNFSKTSNQANGRSNKSIGNPRLQSLRLQARGRDAREVLETCVEAAAAMKATPGAHWPTVPRAGARAGASIQIRFSNSRDHHCEPAGRAKSRA